MKKFIMGLLFSIFSLISYSLNFSVAPTNFNLDLEKSTTQEVYIINNTSKPLRIEAFVEKSQGFENYSLNKNILIFPKKISVKPGTKQTIRFRIKNENLKEDGEYKSFLILKEIPFEIKTAEKEKRDEKNISTELNFITEMAIPVSAIKGKSIVKGFVEDVKIINKNNNFLLKFNSVSTGNTALKIYYEIKLNKKIIAEGRAGTSARTGSRKLSVDINIPQLKNKTAEIILKDQNNNILYKNKKINF